MRRVGMGYHRLCRFTKMIVLLANGIARGFPGKLHFLAMEMPVISSVCDKCRRSRLVGSGFGISVAKRDGKTQRILFRPSFRVKENTSGRSSRSHLHQQERPHEPARAHHAYRRSQRRRTAWKLTQQDAIAGIESGKWTFYVSRGGRTVDVIVSTSKYGHKYLKTENDGEQPDNLLSLPNAGEIVAHPDHSLLRCRHDCN